MRKINFWACICTLGALAAIVACEKENPSAKTGDYVWRTDGACDHILFSNGEEDPDGNEIGNGDDEFVFYGTQTLAKGTYYLKGWVYVADGAQLTIEPGTVIKGDKESRAALIVERGGKLIAQGEKDAPIVFTSENEAGNRKPGDWGGVIICGKARNNKGEMQIEGGPRSKHGGDDDDDNSGVLSYVRIEFAGYPFETDKEINGLTLGSVGRGTKIDHIQVSYSNDDSIEWFGGLRYRQRLLRQGAVRPCGKGFPHRGRLTEQRLRERQQRRRLRNFPLHFGHFLQRDFRGPEARCRLPERPFLHRRQRTLS